MFFKKFLYALRNSIEKKKCLEISHTYSPLADENQFFLKKQKVIHFIFLDATADFDVSLYRINPSNVGLQNIQPFSSNTVAVGNKLSFIVKLTTSRSDLKLVVQNCYATNAAQSSSPRYNVISDKYVKNRF